MLVLGKCSFGLQVIPCWWGKRPNNSFILFISSIQYYAKTWNVSATRCCYILVASPTQPATVYTALKKSITMANQIGLTDVVVVVWSGYLHKGSGNHLETSWRAKVVVLSMGGFHVTANFMNMMEADGTQWCGWRTSLNSMMVISMMVILTRSKTLMQFQHCRIRKTLVHVAVIRAAANSSLVTRYEQFCAAVEIPMHKFWKRINNILTGFILY